MKTFTLLLLGSLLSVEAYVPKTTPKSVKPSFDLQKAAMGAFAAMTITGSTLTTVPAAVDAFVPSTTTIVAEKVIREGIYRDYEVDVQPQQYDDARSTFKPAKETKSKKGKYTALLAILIVGSFIIPMAQYFWYVRDDDSSDQFFGQNVPEPDEKPKKKWF